MAHKGRKFHGVQDVYRDLGRRIENGSLGAVYPPAAAFSNISCLPKVYVKI